MAKRILWILILYFALMLIQLQAQDLQEGDPPLASKINIETDTDVTVTILGEEGTVFPSAQVAIRNLYTGAIEFVQARANGSFEATISGLPLMPYQINVARTFPTHERDTYDILPGIGTIIYPNYNFLNSLPFAFGGKLSHGAGVYFAEGRLNQVRFNAGDNFNMTLSIRFFVDDLDTSLPLTMLGNIGLRRLFDENGNQLSTAIGSGDDWSSELTPTGLPILGRTVPDIPLATVSTERIFVDEEMGELSFRLSFEASIPEDLAAGIYVPVFTGQAAIGNSEPFDWYDNLVFSADSEDNGGDSSTVLPLIMRVGEVGDLQMFWTIFDRHPFDLQILLLRNQRLGLQSILERGEYDFRPKIQSNLTWFMPLIDGELTLDLPSGDTWSDIPVQVAIQDNQIILMPLHDILEVELTSYNNEYILDGYVEDSFGNRYQGGGTYNIWTTRHYSVYPYILPGTLFEVGDTFSPLMFISPEYRYSIPELTYVVLYDSDGEKIVDCVQAMVSVSDCVHTWQKAGTYVVEYYNPEVSSTIIFVGLITEPNTPANGVQGLADYDRNPQAWFDTTTYPPDAHDILPFVNFPFFSGDVAYIPNNENAGINPILSGGDYQYLSIVRPDGIVRQFVRDSNATFDARVSLGDEGNREGDVLFLFGGTVEGDDVRGYSSVAVVTDSDSARVVPSFSEPLLYDRGQPVDMFVLPTGVRPGQVLGVGNRFVNVGYIAPTVAADIVTTIRTPSETLIHETRASSYGYFYEPEHDFTVTEAGVYWVNIEATYAGNTSAGLLPNPVSGTVLGSDNGYPIFVVEADSPMLTTPRDGISQVAFGQAFTINVRAPQTWTDVSAHYVVRTAQGILEQGELNIFANQTNYSFNWPQLARLFPNLETRISEASDMDEITFSFAMTGFDENGNPQIQARIFTLRGNTLYTFGE